MIIPAAAQPASALKIAIYILRVRVCDTLFESMHTPRSALGDIPACARVRKWREGGGGRFEVLEVCGPQHAAVSVLLNMATTTMMWRPGDCILQGGPHTGRFAATALLPKGDEKFEMIWAQKETAFLLPMGAPRPLVKMSILLPNLACRSLPAEDKVSFRRAAPTPLANSSALYPENPRHFRIADLPWEIAHYHRLRQGVTPCAPVV